MFHRRNLSFVPTIALVCVATLGVSVAQADSPATSAFTYQGELRSSGALVVGTRNMKFRLYDADMGGTQIGPELLGTGINLVNGRFTVQLDFGSAPFVGRARWLEIDVSNTGAPGFTTLAPRQAVTATPYALFALNGPAGPPGPTGPAGPVDIVASVDAQFSQDDRAGWTHVEVLGDDTCFPNIPLGFTFTGWGRAVTTVSVSSNGIIFFGQNCNNSFTNTPLPSNISADPFLAFYWDDLLDSGTGEYFEYATFGTAGGRVFNMYFRNRLLATTCGSDAVNIMIAIHEGSNLIRVSYSLITGCSAMKGGSATIGLQGPGGGAAKAFVVSVDAPILDDNAPRQTISFTPPKQ